MLEISTDTATICLFDLQCLSHRKDDIGDWWSLPDQALQEMNDGNVLFLELGTDGDYRVNFATERFSGGDDYNFLVRSGKIFIGPGEETSGGGFEPDGAWGGGFIDVPAGEYVCTVKREQDIVHIFFSAGGTGRNALTDMIRI